jgi:hypothetical protein
MKNFDTDQKTVTVSMDQFQAMALFSMAGYTMMCVKYTGGTGKIQEMMDDYESIFGSEGMTEESRTKFVETLRDQLKELKQKP